MADEAPGVVGPLLAPDTTAAPGIVDTDQQTGGSSSSSSGGAVARAETDFGSEAIAPRKLTEPRLPSHEDANLKEPTHLPEIEVDEGIQVHDGTYVNEGIQVHDGAYVNEGIQVHEGTQVDEGIQANEGIQVDESIQMDECFPSS